MAKADWKKVEQHLNKTFESKDIKVQSRKTDEESAEVYKDEEFLGVIFVDEDEGETSYVFEMAILEIDLA